MDFRGNGFGSLVNRFVHSSGTVALLCVALAGCTKERRYGPGSSVDNAGAGGADETPGGVTGSGGHEDPAGGGASGSNDGMTSSGQGGDTSDAGEGPGPETTCTPSETEPCWETEDGVALPDEPEEALGSCLFGVRTCDALGEWGACIGAVAPLEEDSCEPGADESCNGIPNEGCPCTDGETRPCGEEAGNCEQGTQACTDGAWSACEGAIAPAPQDSCAVEGDDADCDGVPNGGCPCVGEEKEACGDCGERTCDPAARDWGACRGTAEPQSCWETEAGAPLPGAAPETPKGNCRLGTRACQSDGTLGACVGAVPPAATDSCVVAGDDATCDGVTNGGCPCTGTQTRACGSDVGACKAGTQRCMSGAWGMCTGEVVALARDRCDVAGDDSNCNGIANEECPCIGNETEDCNDCGKRTCNPTARAWGACSAPAPAPTRCASNGSLQTCNASGRWASTTCSAPAQCAARCQTSAGVARCVVSAADADSDTHGSRLCTQAPGMDCDDTRASVNPGATEVCDGLDNDCDGLTDMADGLPLSGTNTTLGLTSVAERRRPAIAWSEDLGVYGLIWAAAAGGSNGDIRFQTIDQAGRSVVGPLQINSVEDGATKATSIAWGGDRFGTIYQTEDNRVVFLAVNGEGRPGSTIEIHTSPSVSGNTYSLARVGTGNWGIFFNTCFRGCAMEYRTLSAGGVLGPLTTVPGAVSHGAVVARPNGFVLGYQTASTTRAELRDTALAALADGPAIEGLNPVFGDAPNGFAVATTRQGAQPLFTSFANNGSVVCSARAIGDASFVPAAVIGTEHGYLVVSSGNVRVQHITTGCALGTIHSLGAPQALGTVRVAGGSQGYAVVWDSQEDSTPWRRLFGPRLCD